MDFTELVAETKIWTKRPDLDTATRSAIRRATLKWHRRQPWFKDLIVMTAIANPTPSVPVAVIPIASTFPRWRQFAQLSITGYTKPLEPLTLDDTFDLDGYARVGVYLIAGTNLNIKWLAGFPTFDASYYRDPIPTEAGFDSWIATEYPDLIASSAAADLLAFNNESEIYKAAKAEEGVQFALLQENNLLPGAR